MKFHGRSYHTAGTDISSGTEGITNSTMASERTVEVM
jgi:hypothetical protein